MAAEQNATFAVPMLPANFGHSARQKMQVPIPSSSNPPAPPAPAHVDPSTSSQVTFAVPKPAASGGGAIRRRRFSSAKIQPTRIKKVMQSDEDIGRMIQSVPVAIGRAMEHFAEKFLQAAADATQYTNSKTLTPQHMKQAMLANPHFRFLDTILKDIPVPAGAMDASAVRMNIGVKEQQLLQEQQNQELAKAILAEAQAQMQEQLKHQQIMQMQHQADVSGETATDVASPITMGNPPGFLLPNCQQLVTMTDQAPAAPLGPDTPTTQLAGVLEMLKCAQQGGIATAAALATTTQNPTTTHPLKMNGMKRPSVDGMVVDGTGAAGEVEKPKRGRPKKKKPENFKCVDDELFEEASQNVAKEDKDRQMMPPPSFPI